MTGASWTEVFASLPDAGFFEVVRHYLGPVSTPFHKPDLIARMDAFFQQDDVTQRVLGFIDADDALFLTLIAFHDEATEARLGGLMTDRSRLDIRMRLLNLEERLLIWNRPSSRGFRYDLTPLGEKVKSAGLLGPGTILGPGKTCTVGVSMPWLDDAFLTSALAFLCEEIPLFRKEGGWRKKALETLEERFPVLFRDKRGEDRLLLAGRGLLAAGLARRTGETLEPVLPAWRELEMRDPEVRIRIIRARAAVGRTVPPEQSVAAVGLICESLPEGRSYDPADLAALFRLAAGSAAPSPRGALRIISHLELMGELQSDGDGRLHRTGKTGSHGPVALTVSPAGDIALRPGAGLFCDLALASQPIRHDIIAEFTMNKIRFQSGLDSGMDAGTFIDALEERSGHPLPPGIRTLASEWVSDHREMNLRHGIVLQAEGLRLHILTETGVLDPFAFAHPAGNLWILDPERCDEIREALKTVGIDRIPPVRGLAGYPSPKTSKTAEPGSRMLVWEGGSPVHEMAGFSWDSPPSAGAGGVFAELTEAAKNAGLSAEENEVFEERLGRRLILVASQIRRGAWRYEVMTAKGLDYRGKIRLAEAAISGRDEQLALTVAEGNDIRTVVMLPEKMEKDGDDHVLAGLVLPGEKEGRYKVRKIGFLRRIRTSLF